MAVIGRIYRLDALLSQSTNAVLGRQGLTGADSYTLNNTVAAVGLTTLNLTAGTTP